MGFQKLLHDFYFNIQVQEKPTISIEIGPNEGTFSQRMKQICDPKNIWAFEASPFVWNKYKKNHRDINFLNLAAWDKEDTIEFKLKRGEDLAVGNNSFLERKDDITFIIDGIEYIEYNLGFDKVEVKTITIDNFFKDKIKEDDKICMWIDVEGSSEMVLNGLKETLKKTHSVFIEVEHEEFWKNQWLVDDVLNFFNQNGFLLLSRDFEWYEKEPRQENFIFVNEKYLQVFATS